MVAWKYYEVGRGIKLPYVGVTYSPSIELPEPFRSSQTITLPATSSTPRTLKERLDRKANLLFFCPEPRCSKVCESQEQLEQHCLSEDHDVVSAKSSSDVVKLKFMDRINSSMHEARTIFAPVDVGASSSTNPIQQISLPSNMKFQPGWALPKRVYFRFSKKQKRVLLKIFWDGEEGNNKMSAEQAVKHIRTTKKLTIAEYVKESQVKSLLGCPKKKKLFIFLISFQLPGHLDTKTPHEKVLRNRSTFNAH